MKRAHEEQDVYSGRRPGPPGLTRTDVLPGHPSAMTSSHPSGIPGHSPAFPHPVLAPAPTGGRSFEQMRESLPRPPFSASHINSTPCANSVHSASTHSVSHTISHSAIVPSAPPHANQNKAGFQSHIPTTAPHSTGQQQYQRLKVEDALSYLDQVKLQFGNKPQVYNEFLDIMKEFKSQTIDTPGVISRVSSLFKGHPDLIVGFNTFLPPGYKIEANMSDVTVNICVPGGTTTHLIQNGGLVIAPIQPSKPTALVQPSVSCTQSTLHTNSTSCSTTTPHMSPSQSANQLPVTGSVALPSPLPLISPGIQSQTQAQHHAINYVTKIKNRFQGQPEVYQKFLDILNNYQTEQKTIKENTIDQFGQPLLEEDIYNREGKLATEVYKQVAKLFENQEDLLQEFSQFLPDATGSTFNASAAASAVASAVGGPLPSYQPLSKKAASIQVLGAAKPPIKGKKNAGIPPPTQPTSNVKTEPVDQVETKEEKHTVKIKRHKSALKDVSLAEAVKHGNFSEFNFFDKVRKALKSQDVYENFLRCLVLFNNEVISRPELIQLATTFLGKFPELFTWFKMFLGYKESQQVETGPTAGFKDRGTGGELAHLEIDFASCKRSGASYRALPKSYVQPKTSGRTALCREVLNDMWVSLPSWSEDTQFPGTRKTQYEENIYKCEEERFELDIVIETNLAAIKIFEWISKKLSRMSVEEQQKYRLDSCLGSQSEVINKRAIYRIYGDKAADVIDGLKKTPHIAVPLVLKRLKSKDEEWRTAQKAFNKVWREQNEKYYLKSLDHQGINFKQSDLKSMRSKMLIGEIEQIFEERSDQIEDGNADVSGPHLTFSYEDQLILEDASSLIIHHMKRQTGIHKEDKNKIKILLLHFIQDLFFSPRGEVSDDEEDTNEEEGIKDEKMNIDIKKRTTEADDAYNIFFANNTWYIFLRLHQMLCERLLKMRGQASKMAKMEAHDKLYRNEGTAVALRLKCPDSIEPDEYYATFMEMVKNLLDGHIEANQFEDTCREIFGVHAYVSFTIDKLVQNIVRQLHNMVTDDASLQVCELFQSEASCGATGGPTITCTARTQQEFQYQKKVENLLLDENCFKIIFHKDPQTCRMSVELLPTEEDASDDQVERWAEYIEKFATSSEISNDLKEHLNKKPIFLIRTSRLLEKKCTAVEKEKDNEDGYMVREVNEEDAEMKEDEDRNEDEADASSEMDEKHVKRAKEDEMTTGNTKDAEDDMKTTITSAELVYLPTAFHDLVHDGYLECKVGSNYKLQYTSGTWEYMYRRAAMKRARQSHPLVNTRLHEAFHSFHDGWLLENVTRDQQHQAEDWLSGKASEDFIPSSTSKDTRIVGGLTVTKYAVTYVKETKRVPAPMPMSMVLSATAAASTSIATSSETMTTMIADSS